MTGAVNPLVNFGRLDWFGTPHHGKVENGTLTKADLSTMTYPQPSGGDVRLVEFSGLPAVHVDAAALGMVDHAFISGGSVYTKLLGGNFLYRSPDGNVWRVTVNNGSITSNQFDFDVVLDRFGRVAIPHEDLSASKTVPKSLTDSEVPDLISSGIVFCNAAPDGTKAIYQFGAPHPFYIEISLSGDMDLQTMTGITVAVAVVKKPSQTATMVSSVNDITFWRQAAQANTPTATGSMNVPPPSGAPDPDIAGTDAELTFSSINNTQQTNIDHDFLVDNILWAYYSSANILKFVIARAHSVYTNILTETPPGVSETALWHCDSWSDGGGIWAANGVTSSPATVTWGGHSISVSRSLEITLLVDGATVDQMAASSGSSGTRTPDSQVYGVSVGSASNSVPTTFSDPAVQGVTTPGGTTDVHFDLDIDASESTSSYTLAVDNAFKVAHDAGTVPQLVNVLFQGNLRFLFPLLTNNMGCLQYENITDLAKTKRYGIAHPEGIAAGSFLGDPTGKYYSFNPKSVEVVRENALPVSFV